MLARLFACEMSNAALIKTRLELDDSAFCGEDVLESLESYDDRLELIIARIEEAKERALILKRVVDIEGISCEVTFRRGDIDYNTPTHLNIKALDRLEATAQALAAFEARLDELEESFVEYVQSCQLVIINGQALYEPHPQKFAFLERCWGSSEVRRGERLFPLAWTHSDFIDDIRYRTSENGAPVFEMSATWTGARLHAAYLQRTNQKALLEDAPRVVLESDADLLAQKQQLVVAAELTEEKMPEASTQEEATPAPAIIEPSQVTAQDEAAEQTAEAPVYVSPAVELSELMLDSEELAALALVDLEAEKDDGFEELEETKQPVQGGLFGDIAVEEKQKLAAIFSDEQMIEAAFRYHRAKGFPYREISPAMAMMELNQLADLDEKNLLHTSLGYIVADNYHPHRFHANATGKKSPYQAFTEDRLLRRAIALELKLSRKPRVYAGGMLTLVLGTQACSNFRPGFASLLYRRYINELVTDACVLDTSTGYGGRLVGAIASRRIGLYIGIDPNVPTYEANKRLAREMNFGERAELYNQPAEDVDIEALRGRCDFSFTSPPYFAKERYSTADTQSWVRYSSGTAWRDGFLKKMLQLQFAALKQDTYNIVNIADVNVKGQRYPLADWTKQLGEEAGFKYIRTDLFPMMKRFGANQEDGVAMEPVIVFKKGDPPHVDALAGLKKK